MYDDNNNVIRFIYQVPILADFGLEWRVNAKRIKIVAKDFTKSSQNIILTLKIVTIVANAIMHLVDIKQEVVPKCVNLQLCS